MHHALRQLFVMLIALVALTIEARAQSKILKSECLNFPKMLEFSKMVRGVHYTIEHDSDCDDTYSSCENWAKVRIKYRYDTIQNFEHYTREGKLITISQEKSANTMTELALERTFSEWSSQSGEYLPTHEAGWAQIHKLIAEAIIDVEKQIALAFMNPLMGPAKNLIISSNRIVTHSAVYPFI